MPWRGPEYDGEFPSLGWTILDWATANLTVPDGPFAGEPLELSDEQAAIVVRFFGLDDRGKFLCRRAAVRRAQGWGKSPLLALVALAELAGPSRFDGWDAAGEPVAVRPTAPWVQLAAVSEDQVDNTYAAAFAMAHESELAESTIDVGLTRMYLKGETGRLEPVTASAGTRLGQRVSFAVLDETHLWLARNGGHKLAATIRRNASKMGGRTFESTNAHQLGEDSVAERTFKASEEGAPGLLYDAREAPFVEDLTDRLAVSKALAEGYGDSSRWVPIARLAEECADPGTSPDDAYRFYFNLLRSGSMCPFDVQQLESLVDMSEVPARERIGLGFDGSDSDDFTSIYGCTQSGHLFEIATWEPAGGRVPRTEVHDVVHATFRKFKVVRMLCDPPLWQSEIEEWEHKYTDDIVLRLPWNQPRRAAQACERMATAIRAGEVTHPNDGPLVRAFAATKRKLVHVSDDATSGRTSFVVEKADSRKIDRAIAAMLALEAAMSTPKRGKPQVVDLVAALQADRRKREPYRGAGYR